MTSSSAELPVTAAHIRLHQSLDLHMFDRSDRLIATVPLRDQMVTIYYLQDAEGLPLYKVTADPEDLDLSYHVRIPLKTPENGARYFDGLGDGPGEQGLGWYFTLGFQKNPEDLRTGVIAGIGIVNIADISIGPIATESRAQESWFQRLWRFLFGPQPLGTGEFVGYPQHFPQAESLQMRVHLHFLLPMAGNNGVSMPIRLGAFMGHEANGEADSPFAVICAHPTCVNLKSDLLNTGN
jgi:hypothetical protein